MHISTHILVQSFIWMQRYGRGLLTASICLILIMGGQELQAQAKQVVQLNYAAGDQRISGSVTVMAHLDLGASQKPQPVRKGQKVQVTSLNGAKITFTFQSLNWDSPEGFEGKVFIREGDILSTAEGVLGEQNSAIRMGIGRVRRSSLEILGAGKTSVQIPFRISADGIEDKIAAQFEFPLTIISSEGAEKTPAKPDHDAAWDKAKKASTVAGYEDYLKTFPDGRFASVATSRIKSLKAEAAEAATPPKPDPDPEPAEAREPQDKQAYADAESTDTPAAYEKFLRRFPDSEFASAAEDRLAAIREISITEEAALDGAFEFIIEHAEAPVTFEFTPEEGVSYDYDDESGLFSARIEDAARHTVKLTDNRGKTAFMDLDASVKPIQLSTIKLSNSEEGASEALQFEVEGGRPPYILLFKSIVGDKVLASLEGIPELEEPGMVELTRETVDQGLEVPLEPGSYALVLTDQRKTESSAKTLGLEAWRVPATGGGGGGSSWLPFVIGGVALALVLVFFLTRKKASPKPVPKPAPKPEPKARSVAKTPEPPREKGVPTPEIPDPLPDSPKPEEKLITPPVRARKTSIRVTRKAMTGPQKRPFVADTAAPGTYFAFDLTEHWPESAVPTIYLHKDSISALDHFIQTENVAMIEETPDSIPEIGGFLLGNFKPLGDGRQFLVALEKFVPITPGEQGVYKVEFGEAAWGELDSVMTDNPDLYNIGWFHTHPGHSLFLSQPDIRIHSGFYRENYQVAMEVDTLTPGLDTAFFTRRPDGQINNTKDRMPGTAWFQWLQVKNWMHA